MNWTREKPTVAGWYWWRRDQHALPGVAIVCSDFSGYYMNRTGHNATFDHVDDVIGEWLGPITPDSYQQGRVASCEWKYDDIDDYYETACKRGYSLEDGTLKDNDHKYCPYCGGLIQLAQQAQDGGVGDEHINS